jgi:FkbM family methyltransferase
MMINLQQHQGWYMPAQDTTMPGDMRQGGYQIKHQDGFLQHISKTTGHRGVAVDIGAHIGLWSRKLMQCYAYVYAFEPIPELAECYRKNAQQSNYQLRQMALGDRKEPLTMMYESQRSQNTHITGHGNITVPVERLDDQRIDNVGVIKIDVEGWEMPVLLGGKAIIARDHPCIVVEQKQGAQARVGRHKQDITRLLESWGYRRQLKIANDVLYGYDV